MTIENYKNMEIQKVTKAPINKIFNQEVLYYACKLDFSQPLNYLELYGSTLERVKENIDFYFNNRYKKFVY